MKEKNKLVTSRLLLILAILSFVIATLEGVLYYREEELFFRILLTLQNSINAFAFKPTISLGDTIEMMETHRHPIYTSIGYAYGIAVFTAPYCTIAAVYKFLERMMRFALNFRRRKNTEQILIFGYNADVHALIQNYNPEGKHHQNIHIVSTAEFSTEERYQLSRKGCRIHSFDLQTADEAGLFYLLRRVMADRADNILLFDDSTINNFSMLQAFSLREGDGGFVLKPGAKITCRCEEDSIGQLISDYYCVGKDEHYGYDLELVSLPELQIRRMFTEVPLHTVYLESGLPLRSWHVRMLIVGFSSLGQQALLQAINLGVMHGENDILIDVYDTDIEAKMEIFANQLHSDTFQTEGNTIRIRPECADGTLLIRCHKLNVRFREFIQQLRNQHLEQPFTYALITIDDIDISINCAMRLVNLFEETGTPRTPIVLRMDSDRRLARYIKDNDRTFSNVWLLEDRAIVLTLEHILNREVNRMAKHFHSFYSGIQIVARGEQGWGSSDLSEDALWNHTSLFKRDSSKALAAHDSVKQVILEQLAQEQHIPDVEQKIDALIGENGTLMTYDGAIWHLRDDEEAFLQAVENDAFADTVAVLEHRRWCYFVASLGWRNQAERDDAHKIHNCLMPFAVLRKDAHGKTTIKYDLMALMARYLNRRSK